MTEEEKKPPSGFTRVFGNWFVKYTVLLVALLFGGYALAQGVYGGKTPDQSSDTPTAVVDSVYQSHAVETEAGPPPPAKILKRILPSGPAAPVIWRLPLNQRVVYITIDDGWFPSQGVLALMRQYHLPVTAFLIEEATAEHQAYWREFLQDGGRIEDHTYSHPQLTRIPENQDLTQIADPIAYFKAMGASPDELRPPYGDYDRAVQKIAYKAGIKYVVMWDAIMSGGKLQTWDDRPLAPGDIVLMHWVPGLDSDLAGLIHILRRQNLGVASLDDALDGRPVHVVWLGEKPPVKAQPAATSTTVYGSVYASRPPLPKPVPKTTPVAKSAATVHPPAPKR